MSQTLQELATIVGGTVQGDPTLLIIGTETLESAQADQISLLDHPDKAPRLAKSKAGAVLVPLGFVPDQIAAIQVTDVHAAFTRLVQHFRPTRTQRFSGIHPSAIVSDSAKIDPTATIHAATYVGDDVVIGPGCVIHPGARILAGCELAENVTIFPNVVLYEDTKLGARCIIQAGAVIGAYGFGYKVVNGQHILSAQLGYVELGADVEIGANTTIDRGTYGPTMIGDGTKVDNLVMIAHNCRLGKHNLICSQVGIAGSTTTGDYVTMAGQVGVRDHVHIGSGAVLGAMAGVANDVPEKAHMLGAPAIPERDQKLQFAAISKLPEMRKQIKEHERKLNQLLGTTGTAEAEKNAA
jgi:UDP-3-O-[3-hydroxymyristoyl] glucosamine N-acyltransferase